MSLRQPDRGPRHVQHTRIENEEEIEKYYKFGDTLGKGSFGTVVLAHRCRDESKWAVKIINKEKVLSVLYFCQLCLYFYVYDAFWLIFLTFFGHKILFLNCIINIVIIVKTYIWVP